MYSIIQGDCIYHQYNHVHESTAQALTHAEHWLTWFDAQGGVAGYQQRMRAYYDTYAYTDESYRV